MRVKNKKNVVGMGSLLYRELSSILSTRHSLWRKRTRKEEWHSITEIFPEVINGTRHVLFALIGNGLRFYIPNQLIIRRYYVSYLVLTRTMVNKGATTKKLK